VQLGDDRIALTAAMTQGSVHIFSGAASNKGSCARLSEVNGYFARVFKAQHRIEECLQRTKGQAGLADYQVRTWEGWHHHQTLSLLATWFLTQETRRGKNPDPGADAAASAAAAGGVVEPPTRRATAGASAPHDAPPVAAQRRSTLLSLAPAQPVAATTV
jgi:hypothetical protein